MEAFQLLTEVPRIAASSLCSRNESLLETVCGAISVPVGTEESIAAIGAIQRIQQIQDQTALAGEAPRIWLDAKTMEPLEQRPAPHLLVTVR